MVFQAAYIFGILEKNRFFGTLEKDGYGGVFQAAYIFRVLEKDSYR